MITDGPGTNVHSKTEVENIIRNNRISPASSIQGLLDGIKGEEHLLSHENEQNS